MIDIEIYFIVANVCFIIASVPNIIRAYKDRTTLKGFSFIGASLQVIGITSLLVAYYFMTSNVNVILGIPNYLYWILIAWFNRP
jgi:hypothetical protein